jgi:hypothetical protein
MGSRGGSAGGNAVRVADSLRYAVRVADSLGKSWMASYLSTIGAFIVTNGKIAYIAHAYNNEKIVIFDLSRTQVDKIDHIYALMESFKNGRMS